MTRNQKKTISPTKPTITISKSGPKKYADASEPAKPKIKPSKTPTQFLEDKEKEEPEKVETRGRKKKGAVYEEEGKVLANTIIFMSDSLANLSGGVWKVITEKEGTELKLASIDFVSTYQIELPKVMALFAFISVNAMIFLPRLKTVMDINKKKSMDKMKEEIKESVKKGGEDVRDFQGR